MHLVLTNTKAPLVIRHNYQGGFNCGLDAVTDYYHLRWFNQYAR